MSVSSERTVWCDAVLADGHRCAEWVQVSARSDAYARRAVRGIGWRRVLVDGKQKDLCPSCAKWIGKEGDVQPVAEAREEQS